LAYGSSALRFSGELAGNIKKEKCRQPEKDTMEAAKKAAG